MERNGLTTMGGAEYVKKEIIGIPRYNEFFNIMFTLGKLKFTIKKETFTYVQDNKTHFILRKHIVHFKEPNIVYIFPYYKLYLNKENFVSFKKWFYNEEVLNEKETGRKC